MCVVCFRHRENPLYEAPPAKSKYSNRVTSTGACLPCCLLVLVIVAVVLATAAVAMAAVALTMVLTGVLLLITLLLLFISAPASDEYLVTVIHHKLSHCCSHRLADWQ